MLTNIHKSVPLGMLSWIGPSHCPPPPPTPPFAHLPRRPRLFCLSCKVRESLAPMANQGHELSKDFMKRLAKMPAKVFMGNTNPKVVETRRVALEEYLQVLLRLLMDFEFNKRNRAASPPLPPLRDGQEEGGSVATPAASWATWTRATATTSPASLAAGAGAAAAGAAAAAGTLTPPRSPTKWAGARAGTGAAAGASPSLSSTGSSPGTGKVAGHTLTFSHETAKLIGLDTEAHCRGILKDFMVDAVLTDEKTGRLRVGFVDQAHRADAATFVKGRVQEIRAQQAAAEAELKRLFGVLDANGDGAVSKAELLGALRKADTAEALKGASPRLEPLTRPKHFTEEFNAMDTNHDGKLSLEELVAFAQGLAAKASAEALEEATRQAEEVAERRRKEQLEAEAKEMEAKERDGLVVKCLDTGATLGVEHLEHLNDHFLRERRRSLDHLKHETSGVDTVAQVFHKFVSYSELDGEARASWPDKTKTGGSGVTNVSGVRIELPGGGSGAAAAGVVAGKAGFLAAVERGEDGSGGTPEWLNHDSKFSDDESDGHETNTEYDASSALGSPMGKALSAAGTPTGRRVGENKSE